MRFTKSSLKQIAASEGERLRHETIRLREALHSIIGLDHHNHGPESHATKIARDALNGEQSKEG